jgi:nucleoside 2-deoxyribosyltransferase
MFREEPQAFIALPQDTTDPELRSVIEETLAHSGVRSVSAPENWNTAPSTAIQELLREADFVIANITGANPNVMIEVGMAIGMGKRLLLLSQDRSNDLPFDLRVHQVAIYRPNDVGAVKKYLDLWLRDAVSERESARY